MQFIRARRDFGNPLPLQQALEELRKEPLVKSVGMKMGSLIVETVKIIPKPERCKGTFKIVITFNLNRSINVYIKRNEGTVKDFNLDGSRYHPHIWFSRNLHKNGICWGNCEELTDRLKRIGDVYWLVKLSLELLKNDYGHTT